MNGRRSVAPRTPPGPSSALAAAVTTVAVHVLSQRKLAWGILAEPVDVDVTDSRLASRREIAGEIAARIDAAVRAGICPRRPHWPPPRYSARS